MVTVLRSGGFRVVIYLDDHEPAHVHVIKDGEAKISLSGPEDEPELVWTVGFTNADVRKAMRMVVDAREALLKRWNEIHG